MITLSCALIVRVHRLTGHVKQGEADALQAARYDALTQLPNRVALDEQLPKILDGAKDRAESVAVLFVDVDRFKTINDTLGHRAGDQLLREVATRFNQQLYGSFTVYRNSGDEFVVVVDRVRHKRTIASAAMEVLTIFREPFKIGGREIFVTASVGTSVFPKNAQTAQDLIAYADSAMYRAKEAGRNNAKFYDGSMHARALERIALEEDLRHVVSRNQLEIAYQPIVDLRMGNVAAAEALLRWNHPRLGILYPQAFISLAEETGAFVEISRWVLREAVTQAVQMRRIVPEFRIAVNLSARDFYETDLAAVLDRILQRAGLSPDALDLEVTENVALNGTALTTLLKVHQMGVRIVMDDFGTGYSSFAYIKQLPIDAVKIDKSFVKDVLRDKSDQGIVRAIVTLAQTLGIRIVAEGVETEEQRHFLTSLGCDFAQGYLFSQPQPWEKLVASLEWKAPIRTRALRQVL